MRKRRMAAMTIEPTLGLQVSPNESSKRAAVEEIDGIIRLHKNGIVERPQIMPRVTCSLDPGFGLACRDIIIDQNTNVWARFYVPLTGNRKLPLLVYFHGGGFCVGSASWSCYHEFLAKLASKINCVVVSVNYRLAPENPLPAAYEDGVNTLTWLKKQSVLGNNEWWADKCTTSGIFLAGDSAGANIAYNVSIRAMKLVGIKGVILIQPFFGGELRTKSEGHMAQPPRSALTLAASDAYWRMSLPAGADRDHPWCNPMTRIGPKFEVQNVMVCVSELDILKDRNLELCTRLSCLGRKVDQLICQGVGHAFHILDRSRLSQSWVQELMAHIKTFINNNCTK